MATEFEVTMADIVNMPKPGAPAVCKRCKQNPPEITMRHEALCRDCFVTYLRTKFTRHMEPYRVRKGSENNRKKLLLASSLGVSSTVLLDLLDWHRKLQIERARRSQYDVYVVHIDDTSVTGADSAPIDDCLEKLRTRYTDFEFEKAPLERIYSTSDDKSLQDVISSTAGITLSPDSTQPGEKDEKTPTERLHHLLSSLNSRASLMDIVGILRTRLIVELARINGCEAILLADSMTKMAAMVLAEVTKGRGHALPWLISDGPTPYGSEPIVRPLRELSNTEISSYVTFSSLWNVTTSAQDSLTAKPAVNSKNQTIDEVMERFFGDVSNAHLSANVVKTAAKLEFEDDKDRVDRLGLCEICGLPMDEDPKVRRARRQMIEDVEEDDDPHGKPTENGILDADARIYCLEPPAGEEGLKERRCYGCRRATLGAGKIDWPAKNR